jgi:hypothetical protein
MHRTGIVTETAKPQAGSVPARDRTLLIAGILSFLLLVAMLINAAIAG